VWRTDRQKFQASTKSSAEATIHNRCGALHQKEKRQLRRSVFQPCWTAQQALPPAGSAPGSRTRADRNSYGFREAVCARCHRSMLHCAGKSYAPVWILEGDIKSCWIRIHTTLWLLRLVKKLWLIVQTRSASPLFATTDVDHSELSRFTRCMMV